jgi:hypothetical protein
MVSISCGGSDPLTESGGIYAITEWTDNPDNCDAEGPSILANQPETHFYIKDINFLGEHFVTYQDCDLAECQMEYNDDETIYLGLVSFDGGNDEEGLTGATGVVGGVAGECNGAVIEFLMTFDGAGDARLEKYTKSVENVPQDDDGCSIDAAIELAKNEPCEALEVVTGSPLN